MSNLSRELERKGSRIGRSVNVAFRAERAIARRRLAVLRAQTGLMAFAGLVALIGVVLVNVALFFWLSVPLGKAAAGGVLAAVNFLLAVLLALAATRMDAEKGLEPLVEVRDLAVSDIEAEAGEALDEARHLAENVRRMARDPIGSALPGLIGPALGILAKSLRK